VLRITGVGLISSRRVRLPEHDATRARFCFLHNLFSPPMLLLVLGYNYRCLRRLEGVAGVLTLADRVRQ